MRGDDRDASSLRRLAMRRRLVARRRAQRPFRWVPALGGAHSLRPAVVANRNRRRVALSTAASSGLRRLGRSQSGCDSNQPFRRSGA